MVILDGVKLHHFNEEPFIMFKFVQMLIRKGYKVPKKIVFKDTVSWGIGWTDGSKIQVSTNLDMEFAKVILVHELIHTWNHPRHDNEFWALFVYVCNDVGIDAGVYFNHPDSYSSGKRYWDKFKRGEVKWKIPIKLLNK